MSCIPLFLHALKYPETDSFTPSSASDIDISVVQRLVLWLENQKIRHYTVPDRQALRSTSTAVWQEAYAKYLTALECPLVGSDLLITLQWLCSRAVSLEYADSKDELNARTLAAVECSGPVADWSEHSLPPFPDTGSPRVAAGIQRMLHALHMFQAETTSATLNQLLSVLDTQILPALPEEEGGPGSAPAAPAGDQGGAAALLSRFPLGFSTGEAARDAAATILRMLYIRDLRALQSQVDDALEAVQKNTARPMMDASFGRPAR